MPKILNSSYNNITANNGLGIYQNNNNYGTSSNYGGSGGGVALNPTIPSVANAEKFFKAHFPNFKLPNGGKITFIVGTPPPGATLGKDGAFYDGSVKFYAETQPDAKGENFTIYLDNELFSSDARMHEWLGHELIHVHNYQEH